MRLLIASASKHGSTHEIATGIASVLQAAGHEVDARLMTPDFSPTIGTYDAVILGSAVYFGRWMPEAVQFVEHHRAALATRPVWLFSSGPLGPEGDLMPVDPGQMAGIINDIGARGHQAFDGSLWPDSLNIGEWLTIKVIQAPTGDYRDWPAIRAWASEINAALGPSASAPAASVPAASGAGPDCPP